MLICVDIMFMLLINENANAIFMMWWLIARDCVKDVRYDWVSGVHGNLRKNMDMVQWVSKGDLI